MSQASTTPVIENIRARYRMFAEREAHGVSPLYEELAFRVAESDALLQFLSTLPPIKQQPNLLFGAVKLLMGTATDANEFEHWVRSRAESIRGEILARSTQTNEPGRCATILPVLAGFSGPLALLEVGAAAGLCLLPDRYGYDYGRVRLLPRSECSTKPPVFPCRANEATPVPTGLPTVVWRAGIDLNPLNLSDPGEVEWLESLVWPGQKGRLERLAAAIRVGQKSPPLVRAGDLLYDLPALIETAPSDATLVIFHSAVLAYLRPEDREKFAQLVQELDAVWISNEAPGVFPNIDALAAANNPKDRFILSVDGGPVAFTGPHGQSIDWITQ
tara:strand:- start:6795 stop:7787 length:993 start_codon:yes stop_codon:yes gene_type:complete